MLGLRCIVAIFALLLALPATAAEKRKISIATEAAFPPFNYLDNGEPQGFEIDLGKALCAAMKAECSFVVQQWDRMIKDLVAGQYDAIMASLAITDKRKARIAFSKSYYRIPASFMSRNGDEFASLSPEGLAGKTIGTTANSEHVAFLEERYPRSEIRIYAKFDDASLDLAAERIDLVLGDRLALSQFLKDKEGAFCCRVVGDVPHDPDHYGPGIGVGLRKGDTALKAAFDEALDRIVADGAYDRIRAKYFPFSIR